jgi:hypothetical protein
MYLPRMQSLPNGSKVGSPEVSAEAAGRVGRAPRVSAADLFARQVSTGSQAEYLERDQTIIILDWDDTLCPTTWMKQEQHRLKLANLTQLSEHYRDRLDMLARQCAAFLTAANELGRVVIVTNAVFPWVDSSCKCFLPSLYPLLKTVSVIYARQVYEDKASGNFMPKVFNTNFTTSVLRQPRRAQTQTDPQRWKEVAFEKEIADFYSRYQHQSWKNVISIGDSAWEREAARKVVPLRPTLEQKCRTKTVKLFGEPGIEDLTKQVRVIRKIIEAIVQHDGDLDIELGAEDLHDGVSLEGIITPTSSADLVEWQ